MDPQYLLERQRIMMDVGNQQVQYESQRKIFQDIRHHLLNTRKVDLLSYPIAIDIRNAQTGIIAKIKQQIESLPLIQGAKNENANQANQSNQAKIAPLQQNPTVNSNSKSNSKTESPANPSQQILSNAQSPVAAPATSQAPATAPATALATPPASEQARSTQQPPASIQRQNHPAPPQTQEPPLKRAKTGGTQGSPPPSPSISKSSPFSSPSPPNTPTISKSEKENLVDEKEEEKAYKDLESMTAVPRYSGPEEGKKNFEETKLQQRPFMIVESKMKKFVEAISKMKLNSNVKHIYLTSLERTTSPKTLEKFVELDGVTVFKKWIHAGTCNDSVLMLILNLCLKLPVNVDVIKKSKILTELKDLKEESPKKIQSLTEEVEGKWRKLVEGPDAKDSKLKKEEKKKPIAITPSNAFDNMLGGDSKSPPPLSSKSSVVRTLNDPLKGKRHKIQMLDTSIDPKKPVKNSGYTQKPLSADDIKKAKQFAAYSAAGKTEGNATSPPQSPTVTSAPPDALRSKTLNRNREVIQPLDDVWTVDDSEDVPMAEIATDPSDFAPSDAPGLSKKTGKYKKNVRFPVDTSRLELIREFSKDDEENPLPQDIEKNLGDFSKAEKKSMHTHLVNIGNDTWKPPPLIDLDKAFIVVKGEGSKQAQIQVKRESEEIAPAYFFFPGAKIPDSPLEAREEPTVDDSKIKEIPFEELVVNQYSSFGINNQNSFATPTIPTNAVVSQLIAQPQIMNLLSTLTQNPSMLANALSNPALSGLLGNQQIPQQQFSQSYPQNPINQPYPQHSYSPQVQNNNLPINNNPQMNFGLNNNNNKFVPQPSHVPNYNQNNVMNQPYPQQQQQQQQQQNYSRAPSSINNNPYPNFPTNNNPPPFQGQGNPHNNRSQMPQSSPPRDDYRKDQDRGNNYRSEYVPDAKEYKGTNRKPCKYHLGKGCSRGASCSFDHSIGDNEASQSRRDDNRRNDRNYR